MNHFLANSFVGIATGTVLYVVFFEIIPKGKIVGGTGKQHIAAMILGFAVFLPSLYFHEDHEKGAGKCHDHNTNGH